MRKLDEMTDELRGELRRGDYLLAPGESAFPPKIRAALQSAYDLGRAEVLAEIASGHGMRAHQCCDEVIRLGTEVEWMRAAVGEWRKAESAVDCEACAVIGASLPEGEK